MLPGFLTERGRTGMGSVGGLPGLEFSTGERREVVKLA